MFIQTENTPNPDTLKFLPGKTLLENTSFEAKSREESAVSPLAERLFSIQGVQRVFIAGDFVSVTKDGDTDWVMLKSLVLAALMEHLSLEMSVMSDEYLNKAVKDGASEDAEDDDEITLQIKELLDTRVRPMVAMDGGDIVFDKFDSEYGIVYLRMQGACAGCPSSTATLKMGIENMLRHFIPEVQEVRPVEMF